MSLKPIVIFFLSAALIAAGYFAVLYFKEPTSPVKNLQATNITSSRISLSWTTEKPTKGLVVLSKDKHFPILPFLMTQYKDDGEKNIEGTGLYTTHHVTINNLSPKQIYHYRIYQGLHKVSEGKIATVNSLETLPLPHPVFGQVVGADKKTPVVGAIVYFWAKKEASQSAVLSTLTNIKGGWVIDTSSLRGKDFSNSFTFTKDTQEMVLIDTGKMRVQAGSKTGQDQPWPTIIVKDK